MCSPTLVIDLLSKIATMVPIMFAEGLLKVSWNAGALTSPPIRPLSYPINMKPSEVSKLTVSMRDLPCS